MVTDTASQADDTTAFLRAARSGNLEKVVEFLNTDLDINTANSNGLNALHLASKDGHVEIVTELLKRGAKVDAATKKGNTALHIASLAGQEEIVNILIQYGAAVNIQSQNGFTPLYMAAQENHDQVVKVLLSNGANQSLATEDGFTPLAVAMQQGHDKVVSVLLENDSKGKVRLPALHIAAKKNDCKAADLLLQNDHKPDVTSKSGFTPLHIASHYGYEEIARLLIKRGADVNYLAKHNISPLHVAAKWGKNNMVKVLLENSAQIDAKTRDGLTPLHCAARSGHEQVIITLLEHSAPISARTKNGLAPLHMASQGDHVDAARVLLYHRAPVDEVTIDYLTSLHVAAHCGHVRVAKLLLDRKADPNARALNGFTPLHIACKKNKIKVVELLLKHGASIESTTESGLTPLHVASFMGCMNIVIFLLQHEANPDVPTVRGETPLHLAARANQTDIIRILLRNGAKVDARAREQQTPLHIASRLGNIDIVMLLLQHGAAVDTTTKDMYTALHIASKEGQEEVAAILVENNASLNATTKNGFTPLHIAAKYGNMSVAKILLQRNSVLDVQGKNDISPLHLACHYDHPNVANLLLEKGASPHLASQNGHTPLHIAARKNQMEIASTLLENGADANAESKAGFTPLHLSAQKGHYDMTNLLIEHGADPNHKSKNGLTALHLCAQEDFIRVASILVKNGANVESETETGYRPIHVAAHFGNLSMIRFLLKHNADINVKTNQNYTPLHQAAQQGHAHIVTALLEGNASHKARTNDGLTALNIAQKLGYISVTEVLKGLSYDTLAPDNKNWDEKYKVIAPESLQETSFMSDSDDEGGSDALISEQPYRYLTADLMKSLRDDSLPIDVTRDDPIHRQDGKQEFTQSNNYCTAENFDTEGYNLGRLHFRSFLVSFLVDARGGAMKGCRHSGVRIIVPPRRATMPTRVTCRLVKPSKVANPPPLMEGEALATRIIEMGPVGAAFLGPVLIDIPHFASIQGKGREIIILRSENGETWKEHDNSIENDQTVWAPFDPQMSATHSGRITRIITTEFPQYFAVVTRIKQEVHVIGAEGGILISSVANHVQAVFPPGALTKKIKVGLQAHVIPAELTAKLLGNCVAVSPVITIEPRRRKFHKPITLTIPVPEAANKGMINQYGGETPTLRLLCSIAGGTSESQWEDVTGSTPLTFMNDRVSFTTTVSARFWLMDCRNIGAVSKMATELYEESLYVPYIINFVIYTKRTDVFEATLRILCMTDGKEGMHTLERQEEFVEIVKSRDVEALDGKDLYIEFSGNLVPVTKSGVQLKFTFKAFRQNRLSFHVKVKDPLLDPVARMLFMKEPKVAKGEPPQQPICVLNIVLPESTTKIDDTTKLKEYEDSNIINQKLDAYESKYKGEQMEKMDDFQETSPSEKKFITDTLQKERTDAVTIHESLAQKPASPLESVDASYPSKVVGHHEQDLSPTVERQTYSEKRKFWEDISRKRESYQRSESDVSRTSELTVNESDSLYVTQNIATDGTTDAVPPIDKSETMEDLNVPDISECSVAEKAHYFEEQIQKEMTKLPGKQQQQPSVKSEKTRDMDYEERKEMVKTMLFEKEERERREGDYATEKTDEPEKLKRDEDREDLRSEKMRKTEEKVVVETKTVEETFVKKMEEAEVEVTAGDAKEEKKPKKAVSVVEKDIAERRQDAKEVAEEEVAKIVEKAKKIVEKKREEEAVEKESVEKDAGKKQEDVKEAVREEPAKDDGKKKKEVKEEKKQEEMKEMVVEKTPEVEKKQEVIKETVKEETVMVKETKQEIKEIVKEEPVKALEKKQEEFKQIVKEEVKEIVKEEPAKALEKKQDEVKQIVKEEVKEIVKEEPAKALEKKKQEEVKQIVKEEPVKAAETKGEEGKEIAKVEPGGSPGKKQEEVKEEPAKALEKKKEGEVKEEAVKPLERKEEVKELKEEPEEVTEKVEDLKEFAEELPAVSKSEVETSRVMLEPQLTMEEVIKERSAGKRIITEETTIIYKVQKDGSLVQEQVTKSVQIGDESGKMQTISDVTQDSDGTELFQMISAEEIRAMQMQHDAERKRLEDVEAASTKSEELEKLLGDQVVPAEEVKEQTTDMEEVKVEEELAPEVKQVKKESRIPISTSMSKKETKAKSPDAKTPSKSESSKETSPEKTETVSITAKKKEFESQIPKRVVDTKPTEKKDTHVRKESGTYTITEKKSSEEVTSKLEQHSTTKSETFSKIFADPQEAFKMFEGMDNGKPDYSTVTSKIDQKTSSMLEKKEVKSSEILTGTDKIITHEEKEQVERKKSSESQLRKESPTETVEEKKSKREEVDTVAVQRMSMNLTDKEEVIDASASESRAKTKEEKTFKKLSDKEGVTTHEAGSSLMRESDADVAIRIKKDVSDLKSNDVRLIEEPAKGSPQVEKLAHAESHKETKESFEITEFEPKERSEEDQAEEAEEAKMESLEELQRQKFKEIEARTIAETLIQSIESELEAKSAETLKTELLTKGYLEQIIKEGAEMDHEKLADELTRKFEGIMKRLADKEADRSAKDRASFQEESCEKSSARHSLSDDITKDEESSLHEKEESFPLSSSQARLLDRDITMSPSSMSEQIDFEETMDVDTNELEDLSKPTLSQSEKQEKSGKDAQQQEKIALETSDAWVLEVLEPGADSQSRQDSVDVPSLEMDEHKISEQTSRGIPSLRDTDSFEKMARSRDITVSPSTVSEDTNVDSSLVQESSLEKRKEAKRTDSFEIESPPLMSPKPKPQELEDESGPPLMSPKLKLQELDIKPINWTIGEKKIEITETLQPSQIFNQELEAYESMQRKRLSSQEESVDLEPESGTKSSEEVSVIESTKEVDGRAAGKSEQDFDSEMVENKLDVSLQELVDMLQRENDEKTSMEDYSKETDDQKPKDVRTEEQDDQTGTSGVEDVVEKGAEEASEKQTKTDDVSKKDRPSPKPDVELKLEKTTLDGEKSVEEGSQRSGDELKEWTETYLSKMKTSSEDYKRHVEKTIEKHEKPSGRSSTVVHTDTTCAFKIKKDYPSVDLSARYAITLLDQVVKKEIAEVKESLEAAKQDLIEELSENSETVIQIKDSPSEFQFKLQPESIPNDMPLLYKPPSPEPVDAGEAEPTTKSSDSPVASSHLHLHPEPVRSVSKDSTEPKTAYDESPFSSFEEPIHLTKESMPLIVTEKPDYLEAGSTVQEDSRDEEEDRPSPILASRSGSDVDNKDESSSLALPRTVLRRRHKPSRASRRVTSESEADVGSSSGDSSNYQSCDYEYGSGSRPSSSDMEALQSCGVASATVSEYETAVMSVDSSSKPTSQDYFTAATTMSSRESMKSLASLSSGHLGSIDSTSEMSETLVASEADDEKEEEDNLRDGLEDEKTEQSDSSSSDIPIDESADKIDSHVPYRMKRSSEMIFPQGLEGEAAPEDRKESVSKDAKGVDSATSTASATPGALQSVDIMTSRVSEDGIQSVCTQVSSVQVAEAIECPVPPSSSPERKISESEVVEKDAEPASEAPEYPELKRATSTESPELSMQTSTPSIMQQASMSTSSASAVSVSTVVGKEKLDRRSPDSDSFEMVDKPDIIDDFVVVEEVGREAEEFDSEGKSIRISSMPIVSSKNYDRELENLIASESKEVVQTSTGSQPVKRDDLFDFESEESPPQASNEDQYSQSYSDEEQYDGSKKWIEMQFHADPRGYDIEYDRGPLEDIKEEEITDFEAGSSRFGSLGSHKESIGSVGSMRGSFGSTPDYDVLAGKKYFVRPSDHDNVSLSSLQEFEHLESAVAAENSKKLQQCGSHDSVNNGSLPRRYTASKSGHGDDVSLSSLKDFEGLEKACREAHIIELRAREEEDLLEHESPENKYKLESLRARVDASTAAAASFNPSTSGSDDYEKRIKEIDEIIRIAQTNVERFDRQDDTTEDISQIEIMDAEKTTPLPPAPAGLKEDVKDPNQKDGNVMETSTDSLELEDNMDKKHHPLCRSSDSLEMKTTLDFPSLSSDSLNNVRDGKETQQDVVGYANNLRRISSDSLDMPHLEPPNLESQARVEGEPSDGPPSDNSLDQGLDTTESNVRTDKTRTTPSTGT